MRARPRPRIILKYDVMDAGGDFSEKFGLKHYQSILDNLPVAVFAKDATDEFRFLLWNKKQETISTIPRQRALGRTDYDLFSQESAQYFREMDEKIVRSGKPLEIPEEILETGDRDEVYLHTYKIPIFDHDRTILVGISEDVTETVTNRKALQKASRTIQAKEQEIEKTQLQLIQIAKLESIGQLAAGVAHEVKNPLNLILQGVEYLDRTITEKDENTAFVIEEMNHAITRATKIINELVDFSTSSRFDKRECDLAGLLDGVLLMLRHDCSRLDVQIDRDFAEGLTVHVDQAKFEQVILNVVINAIHALRDVAQPRVAITTRKSTYSDERSEGVRTGKQIRIGDPIVEIEIGDNGAGISPEHLDKVFDPFFTTKPTGVGTGLGLSVVRKIVELHDGFITITNHPTLAGAMVKIVLPE